MSFGADGRCLGAGDFGKLQTPRIDRRGCRQLRGNPRPLGDQESVGGDAQGGVMMEAAPAAPFIVSQAQFLFELLVIARDATLMVWTPPDGIDVPRWWC